jgi:hypothetical protein
MDYDAGPGWLFEIIPCCIISLEPVPSGKGTR